MKTYLIAAAALSAGAAAFAQVAPVAQPAPAASPAPAPVAHPGHDGPTSRDEMVKMAREHFGKLDANKDGAVTREELAKHSPQLERRLERRLGAPGAKMMGDGPALDANAVFDRLDSNKDGAISREEFARGREHRIERRIVMREDHQEKAKDGSDAPGPMMRMHRGGHGARMIAMADSNHDGKITLAEAEAMAISHFTAMDSNKDGTLTNEERRSGRRMMIKKIEKQKTAS